MTAVEWLENKLDSILPLDFEWDKLNNIFKQAKEMEKEQIIEAYLNGYCDCEMLPMDSDAEQYYNETFNK
jgi:hypothetical protein